MLTLVSQLPVPPEPRPDLPRLALHRALPPDHRLNAANRPIAMRPLLFGFAIFLALQALAAPLAAQQPGPEDGAALAAAEGWLRHIDAGRFEQSWEEASALVRDAVPMAQWAARMREAREQVGTLVSRDPGTVTRMTDPPGAPAGEYARVAFPSVYSRVTSVSEQVFLRRTGESWEVAGYFLRPP